MSMPGPDRPRHLSRSYLLSDVAGVDEPLGPSLSRRPGSAFPRESPHAAALVSTAPTLLVTARHGSSFPTATHPVF